MIEAKNLHKIFTIGNNKIHVLKGVDINIEKGEFVAITGYSGSGKSTLMHLLGCLDKPTEGEYLLEGENIMSATRDELAHIRNKKIGFVFQKFHLLPNLTALDNVALPALYAKTGEVKAREKAREILTNVELADRMDHFPYQLSGGQQQRVAIARSLVNDPAIMFADEPTGNLDTETGEIILAMLELLNQKGMTIIMVTHEPYIAQKAHRIVHLKDGQLSDGSLEHEKNEQRNSAAQNHINKKLVLQEKIKDKESKQGTDAPTDTDTDKGGKQ
ncbi:MAG: ABC transporter ATP-binding protein [Epsilonproteobacteria bacterium]|nr:ABC transporter ATP-binding protein [Campylobacterota bacterium]